MHFSKRKPNIKAASSSLVFAVIIVVAAIVAATVFYSSSSLGPTTISYSHSTTSATKSQVSTSSSTRGSSSQIQPQPATVSVTIVSGAHNPSQSQNFVPNTITVVIGLNNTVTWTNKDVFEHTVTSNSNAFDSGPIQPGSSFKFTFTTPGTFAYHCSIHPFMTGTVRVLSP